jgi:putative transposase
VRFIAEHKDHRVGGGLRWGVESICRVLTEHGCPIAASTYYDAAGRAPSRRALRDADLAVHVARVHAEHYGVYGARKVWLQLNREGVPVARCTVERLMRTLGLRGVRRGRRWRTTIADPAASRPADLVGRRFDPPAPNVLWVADFTYCPTWSGMVYVAFVIDAYSRRVLGWRAATSMTTTLVLDAVEQAIWVRARDGIADLTGLVHHTDAGSQGGFNWSSQHPDEKGCVDGTASGMDDDGDGAAGDAVAGQAAGPPRCGALVLGEDRGGADQRGRRCRVRCVGTGRFAMVPGTRRHAFDRPRSVVGQISVVR